MRYIQLKLVENSQQYEEEQKIIANLRSQEQMVRYVMEKYPPTRGDDVLLYRKILHIFYPFVRFESEQFENLFKIPAPESISRARRKIQQPSKDISNLPEEEQKKYLRPTERKQRKRIRRAEIMREYYGN